MELLRLKLNHPCAMDWEMLDDSADGRFCNACGKNVVDFTHFTDAEMYDFFKNKPASVCGLFLPKQISKNMHPNWWAQTKSSIKYAAILIASLGLVNQAKGQATATSTGYAANAVTNYTLKGLILDSKSNNPAKNTRILIYNDGDIVYEFSSGINGFYEQRIDSSLLNQQLHIKLISEDGRVTYEEDIQKSEILGFFNRAIPLYTQNSELPKVQPLETVARYNSRKHNNRRWSFFRKKEKYNFRPLGCPDF